MSNSYIEYDNIDDRNKTLSVKEYLNKIRPYLKDIKINLTKFDTGKIELTVTIWFFSKDNNEECIMHSKFDNIEIMISDKANEIIEKLLNHFLTDIKLQSVTKYYENFKRCVENSPSPPIQCCEPMT